MLIRSGTWWLYNLGRFQTLSPSRTSIWKFIIMYWKKLGLIIYAYIYTVSGLSVYRFPSIVWTLNRKTEVGFALSLSLFLLLTVSYIKKKRKGGLVNSLFPCVCVYSLSLVWQLCPYLPSQQMYLFVSGTFIPSSSAFFGLWKMDTFLACWGELRRRQTVISWSDECSLEIR